MVIFIDASLNDQVRIDKRQNLDVNHESTLIFKLTQLTFAYSIKSEITRKYSSRFNSLDLLYRHRLVIKINGLLLNHIQLVETLHYSFIKLKTFVIKIVRRKQKFEFLSYNNIKIKRIRLYCTQCLLYEVTYKHRIVYSYTKYTFYSQDVGSESEIDLYYYIFK